MRLLGEILVGSLVFVTTVSGHGQWRPSLGRFNGIAHWLICAVLVVECWREEFRAGVLLHPVSGLTGFMDPLDGPNFQTLLSKLSRGSLLTPFQPT